jgi:imidazolonepropionase-like amidohydrolase
MDVSATAQARQDYLYFGPGIWKIFFPLPPRYCEHSLSQNWTQGPGRRGEESTLSKTLFTNVMIFDGSGEGLFPGQVLVEGNHISKVAHAPGEIAPEGAEVIDGNQATLMPGMTEAHAHITMFDIASLKELGVMPVEEHVLVTMRNAKLMLDCGFTSLYSAASAKPRLEVVIRNEINAGRLPGPRIRAASPEISSTGGLGDERQLHMHHTGIEIIADGPDEMRRAARTMIREGVDTIKVNISGDNYVRPGFGEACAYTDAEVEAVANEAHSRACWLSCHARADEAVRMALRHKFRMIYHCEYINDETIDLLDANKDQLFLAPAIGLIHTTAYEAGKWGVTPEVAEAGGYIRALELSSIVYTEIRKRGIRVLPGGDYGFAWNPIGTNARDLEHFVNMYGYTPAEVLMAATKWGGELMGLAGKLGLIAPGYLADILLVRGDPTKDVKILQDRDNLLMIMKDGQTHKPFPSGTPRQQQRDLAA